MRQIRAYLDPIDALSVNERVTSVIDEGQALSPNLGGGDNGIGVLRRCNRRDGNDGAEDCDQDAILPFKATDTGLDVDRGVGFHTIFFYHTQRLASSIGLGGLPLGNCVPVSLATLRTGKVTTLAASGLPTNAAEFPDRPLEAARRTTRYPSA